MDVTDFFDNEADADDDLWAVPSDADENDAHTPAVSSASATGCAGSAALSQLAFPQPTLSRSVHDKLIPVRPVPAIDAGSGTRAEVGVQYSARHTTECDSCDVCGQGDSFDANTILMCDGCDVAVHQACYGIKHIPEGEWLCRTCETGLRPPPLPGVADDREPVFRHELKPPCVFCPCIGGAYKPTCDGRWAHSMCAVWVPGARFVNPTALEPVGSANPSTGKPMRSLDGIDKSRFQAACDLCQTNRGAVLHCEAPGCGIAFHPMCAAVTGCMLSVEQPHESNCYLSFVSYCHHHGALREWAKQNFDVRASRGLHDSNDSSDEEESDRILHDKPASKAKFKKVRSENEVMTRPGAQIEVVFPLGAPSSSIGAGDSPAAPTSGAATRPAWMPATVIYTSNASSSNPKEDALYATMPGSSCVRYGNGIGVLEWLPIGSDGTHEWVRLVRAPDAASSSAPSTAAQSSSAASKKRRKTAVSGSSASASSSAPSTSVHAAANEGSASGRASSGTWTCGSCGSGNTTGRSTCMACSRQAATIDQRQPAPVSAPIAFTIPRKRGRATSDAQETAREQQLLDIQRNVKARDDYDHEDAAAAPHAETAPSEANPAVTASSPVPVSVATSTATGAPVSIAPGQLQALLAKLKSKTISNPAALTTTTPVSAVSLTTGVDAHGGTALTDAALVPSAVTTAVMLPDEGSIRHVPAAIQGLQQLLQPPQPQPLSALPSLSGPTYSGPPPRSSVLSASAPPPPQAPPAAEPPMQSPTYSGPPPRTSSAPGFAHPASTPPGGIDGSSVSIGPTYSGPPPRQAYAPPASAPASTMPLPVQPPPLVARGVDNRPAWMVEAEAAQQQQMSLQQQQYDNRPAWMREGYDFNSDRNVSAAVMLASDEGVAADAAVIADNGGFGTGGPVPLNMSSAARRRGIVVNNNGSDNDEDDYASDSDDGSSDDDDRRKKAMSKATAAAAAATVVVQPRKSTKSMLKAPVIPMPDNVDALRLMLASGLNQDLRSTVSTYLYNCLTSSHQGLLGGVKYSRANDKNATVQARMTRCKGLCAIMEKGVHTITVDHVMTQVKQRMSAAGAAETHEREASTIRDTLLARACPSAIRNYTFIMNTMGTTLKAPSFQELCAAVISGRIDAPSFTKTLLERVSQQKQKQAPPVADGRPIVIKGLTSVKTQSQPQAQSKPVRAIAPTPATPARALTVTTVSASPSASDRDTAAARAKAERLARIAAVREALLRQKALKERVQTEKAQQKEAQRAQKMQAKHAERSRLMSVKDAERLQKREAKAARRAAKAAAAAAEKRPLGRPPKQSLTSPDRSSGGGCDGSDIKSPRDREKAKLVPHAGFLKRASAAPAAALASSHSISAALGRYPARSTRNLQSLNEDALLADTLLEQLDPHERAWQRKMATMTMDRIANWKPELDMSETERRAIFEGKGVFESKGNKATAVRMDEYEEAGPGADGPGGFAFDPLALEEAMKQQHAAAAASSSSSWSSAGGPGGPGEAGSSSSSGPSSTAAHPDVHRVAASAAVRKGLTLDRFLEFEGDASGGGAGYLDGTDGQHVNIDANDDDAEYVKSLRAKAGIDASIYRPVDLLALGEDDDAAAGARAHGPGTHEQEQEQGRSATASGTGAGAAGGYDGLGLSDDEDSDADSLLSMEADNDDESESGPSSSPFESSITNASMESSTGKQPVGAGVPGASNDPAFESIDFDGLLSSIDANNGEIDDAMLAALEGQLPVGALGVAASGGGAAAVAAGEPAPDLFDDVPLPPSAHVDTAAAPDLFDFDFDFGMGMAPSASPSAAGGVAGSSNASSSSSSASAAGGGGLSWEAMLASDMLASL